MKIRETLRDKYDRNRLRSLARSALSFFKPAKGEKGNYPIDFGKTVVLAETVAEIPRAIDENKLYRNKYLTYPNTKIEVVAEDLNKPHRWAAIIKEIDERRFPLRVQPPVDTEEIFTKRFLNGDIVVLMETKSDGQLTPKEYHLTRVDP